jgi:hypothetical protein
MFCGGFRVTATIMSEKVCRTPCKIFFRRFSGTALLRSQPICLIARNVLFWRLRQTALFISQPRCLIARNVLCQRLRQTALLRSDAVGISAHTDRIRSRGSTTPRHDKALSFSTLRSFNRRFGSERGGTSSSINNPALFSMRIRRPSLVTHIRIHSSRLTKLSLPKRSRATARRLSPRPPMRISDF